MGDSQIYDVAVIGLGAMGSAALWQLARLGLRAVGIDQHHPPHSFGSSHGETRITRQAIGEGDVYVPLALRSHALWKTIEAETGRRLLEECGFLLIAGQGGAATIHGKDGFSRSTIRAAERYGIPHEILDAAEIGKRFPQFTGLEGEEAGYYEPGGGFIIPEACVAAQLQLAQREGAVLRFGETVYQITPGDGCTHIDTDTTSIMAGQAVICAGAWISQLLPERLSDLFKVYRQALHWFPLGDRSAYRPDAAPTFIRMHGASADGQFYGFPPLPGAMEIKLAEERYLEPAGADLGKRAVDLRESAAMFGRHAAGRMAGLSAVATRSETCFYTTTPDGDFIIDRHPDSPRITIVSACSGHGFKHSAAIGECVAQDLAGEAGAIDLSAFRFGRFGTAFT